MQLAMPVVLALSFLVTTGSPGFAKCDPSTDPDKSDVANARAAVDANCNCAGAPSRSEYVRCARRQADAVLANKSCRSSVKRCAARSTCGKVGFQTCCRTANGRTKCSVEVIGTCTAPKGGSACSGNLSSCCDACTAGSCAPSTTTTSSTTSSTLGCVTAGQSCGGFCGIVPGRCEHSCGVGNPLVCVSLLGGGPTCTGDGQCPSGFYRCIFGGPPSPCDPGFCEPICP